MAQKTSAAPSKKPGPAVANIPPGLDCLRPLSGLVVVQEIDTLKTVAGVAEENNFAIYSNKGEIIFWVQELTSICGNCCVPSLRPVRLNIFDVTLTKGVLHMRRPARCLCCCFPTCLQIMEVYESSGDLLGTVEQTCRHCWKKFLVRDEDGEVLFFINGKCCICCQSSFKVVSRRKDVVGTISKKLEGIPKDMFTDSDMIAITFPQDLNVRQKAILLGALFLIEYMYFQEVQPTCPWFCF